MTNKIEQVFICLFVIYMSFSVKYLFKYSDYFFMFWKKCDYQLVDTLNPCPTQGTCFESVFSVYDLSAQFLRGLKF